MAKQYQYRQHPRSRTGVLKGQKRSRIFRIYNKRELAEFMKYKKGPIRYGFLVSALDPFFFPLIYRNPQWKLYNKTPKVIRTIFRMYEKSIGMEKKLFFNPVTNEIDTMKDIKYQNSCIEISCFHCHNPIILKYPDNLNFQGIHCESCIDEPIYLEHKKDHGYLYNSHIYLNDVRLQITNKLQRELIEIKKYLDKNREKLNGK